MQEKREIKKLYRSRSDRYIGGVSGGLADYFNMDSNIIRVLFVVLTFFGGISLILYLVAFIIIPENPSQDRGEKMVQEKDRNLLLAIVLIVIGGIILVKEFGIFGYFHFWRIPWISIWALFLIVIGILLILSADRSQNTSQKEGLNIPNINKIYRSKEDKIIAGVCAGIADYFKIDPAIVRLLWVLGSFISIGLGLLVYIILIFILPQKSEETITQ